jgi:diguanylate cyclase (GGDEF)-like protein
MVTSPVLPPMIGSLIVVIALISGSRIMEVTQGIVLPVLLAAIVANTVILLLVVVAARVSRRGRTGPATRSAIEASMLSTSFIDRSGRAAWDAGGRSGADAGHDDGAADDVDEAEAGDADDDDVDDVDGPDAQDPEDELADDDVAAAMTVDVEGAAAAEAWTDGTAAVEAPAVATAATEVTSGLDALTGLLDASAFTRLVIAEDVRIHRYHRPATVVIFELEGLDRLIDRLGQDAADRIVPALADTVRRLARDVDHVARLAPGRFGVLMPETDEVAAINYIERVRRACELWLESGAIALRLATGWAGTTGDPTLVQAQRLATDRMYLELRREARRAPDR